MTKLSPKDLWHRRTASKLRKVAEQVSPGAEVRSNKAGPAIGGEVILHGDRVYCLLTCPFTGYGDKEALPWGLGYARRCDGKKDYHGGPNHTIHDDTVEGLCRLLGEISRQHRNTGPAYRSGDQ